MKTLTIKDIRNLKPCYYPTKYLPKDWTGTVKDILLLEECPPEDRIWVAVRLMPRLLAEVFAIDCAVRANNYAATDRAAADRAAAATRAAAARAAYANTSDAACACAYDAATYTASAYAYAACVADVARKQERENQIDALLMLLEGE